MIYAKLRYVDSIVDKSLCTFSGTFLSIFCGLFDRTTEIMRAACTLASSTTLFCLKHYIAETR